MDKEEILHLIQQTAAANGGASPGWRKVSAATGIKYSDWCGVHWARWNDALRDAGLAPNEMTEAYDENVLLHFYAELAMEIGRLPTNPDLRCRAKRDGKFPDSGTFGRIGSKIEVARKIAEYCSSRAQFSSVVAMAKAYIAENAPKPDLGERSGNHDGDGATGEGFVYMVRLGKYFKIGHTTAVPRRHREIALELPMKPLIVHTISTDDPAGIERYWHSRFQALRTNGEWFALTAKEVRIFKKRRTM